MSALHQPSDGFPFLMSCESKSLINWNTSDHRNQSIVMEGNLMTISDAIIVMYLQNAMGLPATGGAVSLRVACLGEVGALLRKTYAQAPKKRGPNPVLAFVHKNSVKNGISALLAQVSDYIDTQLITSTLKSGMFEYNIYVAEDIPDLFIVEKRPKDISSAIFFSDTICHVLVHKSVKLVHFSDIDSMRF